MRSFLTTVTGAWLALSLAACAKTTSDSGLGTNTNWLRTCEEASDCDGDDVCVCGQCTEACTESSECSAVHEAASCEPVDESACGASIGVTSACLQSCTSRADCTALEHGRCVEGLCVPAPEQPTEDGGDNPMGGGGGGNGGTGGNNAGNVYALSRMDAAIQITDAYTACERHSECQLVDTTCNGCCAQGAIHSSLYDEYTANMTAACEGYEGAVCDCAFEDVVPRCENNRCAAVPRSEVE